MTREAKNQRFGAGGDAKKIAVAVQ